MPCYVYMCAKCNKEQEYIEEIKNRDKLRECVVCGGRLVRQMTFANFDVDPYQSAGIFDGGRKIKGRFES